MSSTTTSMTTEQEDDLREKFETALRSIDLSLLFIPRDANGRYKDSDTEYRWRGLLMAYGRGQATTACSEHEDAKRGHFEQAIQAFKPNETFVARWPDGIYKHYEVEGRWQGWLMACREPLMSGLQGNAA
jgi:hypothetical protein